MWAEEKEQLQTAHVLLNSHTDAEGFINKTNQLSGKFVISVNAFSQLYVIC